MLNKPPEFLSSDFEKNKEPVFEVNIPENLEPEISSAERDDFSKEISRKFPYIKRIVGVLDDSDKEFVSAELAEANEKGLRTEGELAKTEREIEMITLAKKGADEILSEFGGADLYDIPPERIHVLKKNGDICGRWDYLENKIDLARQKSAVKFVMGSFHEIIHSKAYIALQILREEKKRIGYYRQGLNIFNRDGKESYLRDADEAAVYELEKMFFDRYVRNNDYFSEEEKREELNMVAAAEYVGEDSNRRLADFMRSFSKEILRVADVSKYKDAEDIKKLMIRSAVNGNIMELGRLIKKAVESENEK